jgi:hypothetical protein
MAPYAHTLLMVRGVRAMNEWSFQGTLGQTTDPHTQVCGSYFTCQPVAPADAKFTATPTGRSLDHVCAEQINRNGAPPLFIQIGGRNGSQTNTAAVISYQQPGQIFPGFGSPMEVFSQLTNLFRPGPTSPETFQAARRRSAIDVVRSDFNNLKRIDMSASDRRKLSSWADGLHQTSRRLISPQCSAATATALGVTSEAVAASAGGDLSKTSPLMMDLAVLAAICDHSRVIFLKMPPNYVFRFLGMTLESASLSHRVGSSFMGGGCVENVMDLVHKIDTWYAQQFAHLVGRLDGIQEGDRTLLDNTATVWFQEMSDGNSHNLNNLPILQAGSCGGYFKVGQAVNVEGGRADLTPGHSDDDCQNGQSPVAMIDAWGTPPDQATMPINKYYCNLMNAIGVKAGADGFPLKGGTQAVTHYGKYDDTRLFTTAMPATITNPGEYSELRA